MSVRSTQLVSNNRGIHIASGTPDLGTIADPGFNAIHGNTEWQVFNASSSTISAQNNFWASTDSATIDGGIFDDDESGSSGQVVFTPFLTEDPFIDNLPPVLATIGNQTVTVLTTLDVPISATDPDDDPITLSVSNLPAFASFTDNGDGTDHGSGGVAFLIGDGVQGGHYGEYPSMEPNKLIEGDLEFSLDFRSLYTEILEDWLEVDARPIVKAEYERVGFLKD